MDFSTSVFVWSLYASALTRNKKALQGRRLLHATRYFTRLQDLEPFERCEATFTLRSSFEPRRKRYILSISLLIPL